MSDIEIVRYPAGPLDTNGYLYCRGNSLVVIDPSYQPERLLDAVAETGLKLSAVLLTHCHFDHYLGIHSFRERYPDVPIYAHEAERLLLEDADLSGAAMVNRSLVWLEETLPLEEGELEFGDVWFRTIHVAGHTPGGILFYDGAHLFSGDNLFAGSVGRSDFAYSDPMRLITDLREKVLTLPGETVVFPGHGGGTTIAQEKQSNPFL